MIRAVDIAKALMRTNEVFPVFDLQRVGELGEVFNHPAFLAGGADVRRDIMHRSSESKYRNEFEFPFDKYFGFELRPQLEGRSILDLGCFTGGRSIAWFERFGLSRVAGTDVSEVYIEAATNFASIKQVNAHFRLGSGEELPYEAASFDAVLTFDVLEHVIDVRETLDECYRVLKPGGKVFLVFPTYYQPLEHHLGLVSRIPGLQMLFSGPTLVRAYYEILEERGETARWYRRQSPDLKPYERGHTINGTSFRQFKRILKGGSWDVEFVGRKVIGSIGRAVDRNKMFKLVSLAFAPLAYVPSLQEVFLHRVTMVIRKRP